MADTPMRTISAPLGDLRKGHATAGGNSSSTTAAYIGFPDKTKHVFIEGRNYSTAVVVGVALCPYLVILQTRDNLQSAVDYSRAAQDGDTGTSVVMSALSTAANGDYLYVGSHIPFRGVHVDVDGANGDATVITVNYWNGMAWTGISATDNTASGGASLAQDGTVTWTVPTDWVSATLAHINTPAPGRDVPYRDHAMYWTRWQWSVALDAATTLDHMLGMNRSTNRMELVSGRVLEMEVEMSPGGYAGVEHATDAGTASILVNVGSGRGQHF